MESNQLMDAFVQVKRMGNFCNEVMDLSQQLAEALDRNDRVSVQMLVSMRQEPIEKLQLADRALRQQINDLGPENGQQLADLLNGGPGKTDEEKAFAAQVAANSRVLRRVIDLDKVLNQKIKRESEGS